MSNYLTFTTQIFIYFVSSILGIFSGFFVTIFQDTGNAIVKVISIYAPQLISWGLLMPVMLVITVSIMVMAIGAMLMVTSLLNDFLD